MANVRRSFALRDKFKSAIQACIRHLAKTRWLSPFWKIVERICIYALSAGDGEGKVLLVYHNSPKRGNVVDLIQRIRNENNMLLLQTEAYQLYMTVAACRKIPGELAEVGVYRGGSATVICEAKDGKPLHLFDTFEGIPSVSAIDQPRYSAGDFASSLELVTERTKKYQNVRLYKGIFPATGEAVKDRTFSFVHVDVDTYQSTLDCLNFFYPRMSKGGVIISHDYASVPGVKKAVDDFFLDRPEVPLEVSGSAQCLIVKM